MHKILEFDTQNAARACLSALNEAAALYGASQNHEVIETPEGDKFVIGKNAATGEDDPRGVTRTWDIVQESPEHTFYLAAPAGDPRFENLPLNIFAAREKVFPVEWYGEAV